jgi:hypothetical protein
MLLIISVFSASAFFYEFLYITYNARYVLETNLHCLESARETHPHDMIAYSTALNDCLAPMARSQALWTLLGIALLLLVAGLIFQIFPSWKIWRNRLVHLNSKDAPDLVEYLIKLCSEIELVHTPIFLCAPLNRTMSGLVFGRIGRYFLVLNGGLVTQFYKDREAFRTVVLHELAHLRNADVNKTYFSVALWKAFVIAGLIPFVVSLIFRPSGFGPVDTLFLINLVWRVIALASIVYLTYKAILRVREFYADVRASVYGTTVNLLRILPTLQTTKHRRWGYLQAHPDPNERRRTLTNTSGLFRIGFWEAFGTGVIAMIAFSNIFYLLHKLSTGKQNVLWVLTGGEFAALGAALIFMPPIAGVVVLGVWRERFAELILGVSYGERSRLALGLAAGAVLGQFLTIRNAIDPTSNLGVVVFGYNVLWSITLLAFLFFLVHWVAETASLWLGVTLSMGSARSITIAIIFTSALLLFVFGPLFLLYTVGLSIVALDGNFNLALISGLLGGFMVSATYPHTILAFISLWAFPLVSQFWRNSAVSTIASDWVFLNSSPQNLLLPNQEKMRTKLMLLIGLVGGLIWSGFILGIFGIAGLGVIPNRQLARWCTCAPVGPPPAAYPYSLLMLPDPIIPC